MNLAIIVVNYRTADLVIDGLYALGKAELPPGTQIVVVDGNSGDGSFDRINATAAELPHRQVSVLGLDLNGGFAYANNKGIEHVLKTHGRPDFFLLLNPDTIARPDSISTLLNFMNNAPRVGFAGSRLEDPDGTPQACAFRFPTPASELEGEASLRIVTRLLRTKKVAPEPSSGGPQRVDWVSGAAMMVRADVFDDIGLMDDGYFLYYEELDLVKRASRMNWECWHVPHSRVVHLVGQATGVTKRGAMPSRRPAYWFESRRRYFLKNHGFAYAVLADGGWIVGHLIWRARNMFRRRRRATAPRLLGDFISHSALFRKA